VAPGLAFKALGYGLSGILLLAMLIVTFVSIHKEARSDEPIGGLFPLALIIIAVCTLLALCTAYQTARSFQKSATRMQTQTIEKQ
jgi:hypothetical protein